MARFFKRTLSILLAALLILSAFSSLASAVSLNDGIDKLRAQWKRSTGPSAGGYALEYSYYVPKNGEKGSAKPLFVFMAGAGEGKTSGKELTANSFANWSSEEFQGRVTNADGAFLQILKAPEPVYFDTCPVSSMYAAITDFASKHNVDSKRIYLIGWCIGAVGTARLALAHPDYFAGAVFISMRTTISDSEAKKLKNMAIWILGCTNDSYSTYSLYTKPSWDNVKAAAENKNKVRFTSTTSAPTAGALFNHNLWYLAENDYSNGSQSAYSNLKTVDGSGSTLESPRFISWLSKWSASSGSGSDSGSSGGSGFFAGILAFIRRFFSAILSLLG